MASQMRLSALRVGRMMSSSRSASTSRCFSTQEVVHEKESFLTGTSSIYAEQMLENYQHDPNSVEPSWRKYFDNLEQGVAYNEQEYQSPTVIKPSATSKQLATAPSDSLGVSHLIRAYQ
eukprot:scaffold84093_cov45-Attheya_sp.AAC.6